MSNFKWYRKLLGGYWVYAHFIGWQKVDIDKYRRTIKHRNSTTNGLEDYV